MTPAPQDRALPAAGLMEAFATETGVTADAPPRRYLWTDAFAVSNALSLHAHTGESRWLELALALVDQVHRVLGRHRADDPRRGWISGLPEAEGARRPTAGGLRIGKPRNERAAGEAGDADLEWEQDGQYFHYLTRWMHALARVGAATGEARYSAWAVELASVAHRAFTVEGARGGKRMVWKMSIDLSRPLVPSMGHHDPLDGLVTTATLAANMDRPPEALEAALRDYRSLCEGRRWATDDALGAGGLLVDAYRLTRLQLRGRSPAPRLLERVLHDAVASLEAVAASRTLALPLGYRLPFRELGLAIGLAGVERLQRLVEEEPLAHGVEVAAPFVARLGRYTPLRTSIGETWSEPQAQQSPPWRDHLDINRVMLATVLLPDEHLA